MIRKIYTIYNAALARRMRDSYKRGGWDAFLATFPCRDGRIAVYGLDVDNFKKWTYEP